MFKRKYEPLFIIILNHTFYVLRIRPSSISDLQIFFTTPNK